MEKKVALRAKKILSAALPDTAASRVRAFFCCALSCAFLTVSTISFGADAQFIEPIKKNNQRAGPAFATPVQPPPASLVLVPEGKKPSGGFSGNPFALRHRDSPAQSQQKRVVYRNGEQAKQEEEALSFSNRTQTQQADDRLIPRHSAFSGGEHTLARMVDKDNPPEMSMTYKMNEKTSTRVTVNPQDEASPLYRPAEREGAINSAGVYMNIDVQPNLQLQVGGEYCETKAVDDARENSSRGAALGLKWSF